MTLGLVVGKFYPPHRGHKRLIDAARARCDHLIVILAHHPSQAIPGETRLAWLREIHPGVDVRLVPDELDDDSQQWATWTFNYLGRAPDVVFSSEDYGPVYARLMGARHEMIDRPRVVVPISGTAVRADPLAALDFLEPCVRAAMVPRVVLIGAESTGKTTLAAALARRFETTWVPEYGREYWQRKLAAPGAFETTWTTDEFVHIAAEQQRRENAAARDCGRVLICDTNATAAGTWHERYLGHRSGDVDAIGARDVADLYLLCGVSGAPFVQDGWRDGESIRAAMHARFLERLGGQRVALIGGNWAERETAAIERVERLLATFRRYR